MGGRGSRDGRLVSLGVPQRDDHVEPEKAARPAATTSSRDSSADASGCAEVPEGAFPIQHLRDKRQELVFVPPSTIHHPSRP